MNDQIQTPGAYEEFLQQHPGTGLLRVQVSTARGTFPVPGAQVEVSRLFGGRRRILYSRMTDNSGVVEGLRLPTQSRGASLEESTAGGSGTEYQVSVYHPGYLPLRLQSVTLFDGIETILPVALEPQVR